MLQILPPIKASALQSIIRITNYNLYYVDNECVRTRNTRTYSEAPNAVKNSYFFWENS